MGRKRLWLPHEAVPPGVAPIYDWRTTDGAIRQGTYILVDIHKDGEVLGVPAIDERPFDAVPQAGRDRDIRARSSPPRRLSALTVVVGSVLKALAGWIAPAGQRICNGCRKTCITATHA